MDEYQQRQPVRRRRNIAVITATTTAAALVLIGVVVHNSHHSHVPARALPPQQSASARATGGSRDLPAVAAPTPSGSSAPVAPMPTDPTGPDGAVQSTENNNLALTFDDGPSPTYTPQVLALLAQYHVHATFCLIGQNVADYPDLVKQIVDAGNTICDHSWDHDEQMAGKSVDYIDSEITRCADAIHQADPDAVIRYYRQPGGNWSPTIVSDAVRMGMTPLDWSVDTNDWQTPGVTSIENTVLNDAVPGSIVLMHDGGGDRSQTITALQTLLPTLTTKFHLQPMPTSPTAAGADNS